MKGRRQRHPGGQGEETDRALKSYALDEAINKALHARRPAEANPPFDQVPSWTQNSLWECKFSKIKNIVRKAGARTREALVETISEALSVVTLEDVRGWFAHCGYRPQDQCP